MEFEDTNRESQFPTPASNSRTLSRQMSVENIAKLGFGDKALKMSGIYNEFMEEEKNDVELESQQVLTDTPGTVRV